MRGQLSKVVCVPEEIPRLVSVPSSGLIGPPISDPSPATLTFSAFVILDLCNACNKRKRRDAEVSHGDIFGGACGLHDGTWKL